MAPIVVDRHDGIVTVTLNRPERKNAATPEMWEELRALFADIGSRADDRVVIVTGAGGDFCSGADLAAATSGPGAHPLVAMRKLADTALALHRLTKPTIAKVAGVAAGAGANLALGCDLVVAAEDARFSQIFVRRGLSVDFGGSWLLPRLVGLHKAKELALFGDMVGAEQALQLGLVNRVVPTSELDAAVDEWAARLAAGPPLALSMTNALLDHSAAVSMEQALEDEARCQAVNATTADAAEAMTAFLEKREPRFQGR